MRKKFFFFKNVGRVDGHRRVTRGADFVAVGGDEDKHAEMQEQGIKLSEGLSELHKRHGDDFDDRRVDDLIREVEG